MWELDADYSRACDFDEDRPASRFEFATMAFGAAQALAAAVYHLCGPDIGVARAQAHTLALTDRLAEGLADLGCRVVSPRARESERSAIVTAALPASAKLDAAALKAELATRERIHVSNRCGKLRFSPHVYNTADDIEHALFALGQLLRENSCV